MLYTIHMLDAALRLDAQLCFALHATSRAVVQAYGPILAPLGITYPQYLVLLVLWEEGEATISRLGERLMLDSGTLTPLVKRMEARGLVVRERDGVDGRVVHVRLTAAGKGAKKQAREIPKSMLCAMGLSVDAVVRLRTDVLRLLRSMPAAMPNVENAGDDTKLTKTKSKSKAKTKNKKEKRS